MHEGPHIMPRTRCEAPRAVHHPSRCRGAPVPPPAPEIRYSLHMGFKWPIQTSLKDVKVDGHFRFLEFCKAFLILYVEGGKAGKKPPP